VNLVREHNTRALMMADIKKNVSVMVGPPAIFLADPG